MRFSLTKQNDKPAECKSMQNVPPTIGFKKTPIWNMKILDPVQFKLYTPIELRFHFSVAEAEWACVIERAFPRMGT